MSHLPQFLAAFVGLLGGTFFAAQKVGQALLDEPRDGGTSSVAAQANADASALAIVAHFARVVAAMGRQP